MEYAISEIYDNVIKGDQNATVEKVQQALDRGVDPADLLNEGMIAGMSEVGRRYETGEYFVPEMLVAARAMKAGMAVLKPHLEQASVEPVGKVVVGTVKGDLHDIGKNLVCMMLEGAGFEIVDLGTDVNPEDFVEATRSKKPNLVAMSALLTTTMTNMKVTIDALNESGLHEQVKVIVGGAPLTNQFAQEIGADGYAPNASRAVKLAKSLVKE